MEFRLVTDRVCGAEAGAHRLGIRRMRCQERDRFAFSSQAARFFEAEGPCDFVIMFFSRLVDAAQFSSQPLLNVHPSLLPAFPGFNAVHAAVRAGTKFFGATLHVADQSIDGGPIVAQACTPTLDMPIARLESMSFLHKTALFFLAIDLIETNALRFSGAKPVLLPGLPVAAALNPGLKNASYMARMRQLQEREGLAFL
ncbi:MAG: formyltransferase family protein [Thermoplasmatota archaeon]